MTEFFNKKHLAPPLLLFCLWALVAIVALRKADFGAGDLQIYWLGTKILESGQNPYDGNVWQHAQFAGGPGVSGAKLDMVWNPPILFGFLLPIISDSFENTRLTVIFLNIAAYSLCFGLCLWAWRRRPEAWLTAFILALGFLPFYVTLELGQLSVIILLSLLLSVILADRGLWFLSGALLAPAMIKPHIGFLLSLAIFWGALKGRRWHFLVGAAAGGLALLILPYLHSRSVLEDWIFMRDWASRNRSNALASWLRFIFWSGEGAIPIWPSYMLPLIGLSLTPLIRNRFQGSLLKAAPFLLTLSFLAAPYGYVFDAVILLPGMLAGAAASSMNSVLIILANIAAALLFINASTPEDFARAFALFASVILILGWQGEERSAQM